MGNECVGLLGVHIILYLLAFLGWQEYKRPKKAQIILVNLVAETYHSGTHMHEHEHTARTRTHMHA